MANKLIIYNAPVPIIFSAKPSLREGISRKNRPEEPKQLVLAECDRTTEGLPSAGWKATDTFNPSKTPQPPSETPPSARQTPDRARHSGRSTNWTAESISPFQLKSPPGKTDLDRPARSASWPESWIGTAA